MLWRSASNAPVSNYLDRGRALRRAVATTGARAVQVSTTNSATGFPADGFGSALLPIVALVKRASGRSKR